MYVCMLELFVGFLSTKHDNSFIILTLLQTDTVIAEVHNKAQQSEFLAKISVQLNDLKVEEVSN